MQTRKPVVAGQFYPGQHDSCAAQINGFLDELSPAESLPDTIAAGIVPHAGWSFSGALAAMVFATIKDRHQKVNTFVLFGAAHSYFGQMPAVYDSGMWVTPVGDVFVDEELAEAVVGTGCAVAAPEAHAAEHSIEVQVPMIRHIFPGAKIVPVLVPPREQAVALGRGLGRLISEAGDKTIVCIGSTDLTHYGPSYGFTPMGVGKEALRWSASVNDRKFIDAALAMDALELLHTAAENCNACGPGAAAATVAAAKELGRSRGVLLAHSNSNEIILRRTGSTGQDSVGYAAIVF